MYFSELHALQLRRQRIERLSTSPVHTFSQLLKTVIVRVVGAGELPVVAVGCGDFGTCHWVYISGDPDPIADGRRGTTGGDD